MFLKEPLTRTQQESRRDPTGCVISSSRAPKRAAICVDVCVIDVRWCACRFIRTRIIRTRGKMSSRHRLYVKSQRQMSATRRRSQCHSQLEVHADRLRRSVILPFPSSPHCAPMTTTLAKDTAARSRESAQSGSISDAVSLSQRCGRLLDSIPSKRRPLSLDKLLL